MAAWEAVAIILVDTSIWVSVLRDGMKADIVVFDPTTVKATATPRQPKQFPLGIPYVIVNGKVVVDKGAHTGALPGRALRYGR